MRQAEPPRDARHELQTVKIFFANESHSGHGRAVRLIGPTLAAEQTAPKPSEKRDTGGALFT